jgi:hypothetical protein
MVMKKTNEKPKREQWSSKTGFILAAQDRQLVLVIFGSFLTPQVVMVEALL